MVWTYSGDPASSNRDAVRFLVGDTDTTDQLINDAEITYLLTSRSVQSAAAKCARAIAAKVARQADKAVGELQVKLSQKAARYFALADVLEKEITVSPDLATPTADAAFSREMMASVSDDEA